MTDEEFVREYSNMVYRIAFNYARNKTDADDIFSDVFYKYFKKKRSFSDEEHRKAWLIRVTINCAKDFFSSMSHNSNIDDIGIEIAVYDEVNTGEVLDIIKQLEQPTRDIIYLHYYEQYTLKKIAELLQLNENTVKTKISRAKKKLAEIFIKEGIA